MKVEFVEKGNEMENKFLALDIETGGVLPDTSILTAYFEVLDSNLETKEKFYLKLKPNDDLYVITVGGMAVNKINLLEHDKVAITYSAAGQKLREFLKSWSGGDGKTKLIPIGKNIYSDIAKINDQILGAKVWEQYVTYSAIELNSIVRFLQLQKKLPNMDSSLSGLVSHLEIKIEGTAHEADYDTKATVAVLKKLLAM